MWREREFRLINRNVDLHPKVHHCHAEKDLFGVDVVVVATQQPDCAENNNKNGINGILLRGSSFHRSIDSVVEFGKQVLIIISVNHRLAWRVKEAAEFHNNNSIIIAPQI